MLQGIFNPSFVAYDYVYSLDVLKIPLSVINMKDFVFGNLRMLAPILYQRFYINKDFKYMLIEAQRCLIVQDLGFFIMAL